MRQRSPTRYRASFRPALSGTALRTFSGDGQLVTAPVIANGTAYIGSSSGMVYALSLQSGQVLWSGNGGDFIQAPDEHNAQTLTGLSVGEGLLAVPASSRLSVYQSAGG